MYTYISVQPGRHRLQAAALGPCGTGCLPIRSAVAAWELLPTKLWHIRDDLSAMRCWPARQQLVKLPYHNGRQAMLLHFGLPSGLGARRICRLTKWD